MRGRWALAGLVMLAVMCSSCGGGSEASATRVEVFRNLAKNIALPEFDRLATTTAALEQAVSTLCTSPTPENLEAAQDVWEDAWQSWNETRVFRFAPSAFVTSGISYPADPAAVKELADGEFPSVGPPFNTETLLQQTGVHVRGLEAIGYLLFTAPLSAGGCDLAAASAEVVASTAQRVERTWSSGFDGAPPVVDELANPKRSKMYRRTQEPLDDVVNGMLVTSTEATMALANALAPSQARARSTIHSGTRIQHLLAAVQHAWHGSASDRPGDGIAALTASVSPTASDRVSRTLREAVKSADQLPASLTDASPSQLRRAYKDVRKLTRELDTEIATILGVAIDLTDVDGDS